MACIFWLWASCSSICFLLGDVHQIGDPAAVGLGQIEMRDAGRVVGETHFDGGARPLPCGQLLGGVGAAGGLDQVAERLALLAAAGHGLQRRIGLDDLGFERILPVQQGRAEGRGRGEGVEHLRRRPHGAGKGGQHLHGRRRQRERPGARAAQPHQEAPLAQRRDDRLVLGATDLDRGVAGLAAAGRGQGCEQAGA